MNRLRQWSIRCEDSYVLQPNQVDRIDEITRKQILVAKSGTPRYIQEHGLVDGKLQTTFTTIKAGKNIGRANATSVWDQCCVEAQSLWNKKKDRGGYSEKIAVPVKDTIRPMLAKSYNVAGKDLSILKDGGKIKFPCYAQPKLDGIRCIAVVQNDGSVRLFSRQEKEWHILTHIQQAVQDLGLPPGTILDGELYVHGEEFQTLTSAIKRDKPSKDTPNIQYYVYDVVSNNGYELRHKFLESYLTNDGIVRLTHTLTVNSHAEVEKLHSRKTKQGYEGIMLRNKTGAYKCGGRSSDLQKVKKFMDAEFEIVDAYENKGKMVNQCTFVCITKLDAGFGVKPEGSEAIREQYWTDWKAGKLKGKMLTVRFFAWTTSKCPVPRFPVGISIRDYE